MTNQTDQEVAGAAGATKRCACIDCGTNSVKLIIADLAAQRAERVFETSVTTRVGEGMQTNGMRILEVPMRRTLDALTEFTRHLETYGSPPTAVVATAAFRDAVNRDEFVTRAKQQCGLTVEVIPGEEEARLSYLAVRRDPFWKRQERLLVVDIGGGSTEIIQGEVGTDQVEARISVNLGAVKLTESYLKSDPPTLAQLAAANEAAEAAFALVSMSAAQGVPFYPVGVGGTFTNTGAMMLNGVRDPERLHGLSLDADDLEDLYSRLAERTVAQRREIPGLDAARADIILGGVTLMMHALAHIKSDTVDVSTRGLRWGVLYDRFL